MPKRERVSPAYRERRRQREAECVFAQVVAELNQVRRQISRLDLSCGNQITGQADPMAPLWTHELNEWRAIGAPPDREGFVPTTYANVNRVWPGGQLGLIFKTADGQRLQVETSLRSWLNVALAGAAEICGSVVTYGADGSVVIPQESELEKKIRFAYLAYVAGSASQSDKASDKPQPAVVPPEGT